MGRPSKHAVSAEELARLADVSVATLKVHRRSGAPMPARKADLAKWLAEYSAWRERVRRPTGPSRSTMDPELLAHKREIAKWEAMRKRMEVEVQAGKLLRREDVVSFATEAVMAINQGLDSVRRRLASRLGPVTQGGTARVEMEFDTEVAELRARFAQGMDRTHEHFDASLPGSGTAAGSGDLPELAAPSSPDSEPVG